MVAKSEAINKVGDKGGAKGEEAPNSDEKVVQKTFCLSRTDGWVINKKTKCNIRQRSGDGWWKFYLQSPDSVR